jgi:hypothetical protein
MAWQILLKKSCAFCLTFLDIHPSSSYVNYYLEIFFFLYFSHILTFNVIFKCKYKYIGCSFKSILKVDDEELIVNAPLVSLQSKDTNNAKSEVRFKQLSGDL